MPKHVLGAVQLGTASTSSACWPDAVAVDDLADGGWCHADERGELGGRQHVPDWVTGEGMRQCPTSWLTA